MSAGRSALVIGAGGVLGSLTAREFEAAGWQVVRGGRREREGFRVVDLDREDTIAAALADVDVAVNTVPHPELPAERVALREGGRVVNVSTHPPAAGRALRAQAHDARGTVLLNSGVAPGVTNLVAADLLARHPDADVVEIALTISAGGASGRAGGTFAHRGFTSARKHRTRRIPLPEPYGERTCLGFAEEERGWLGDVADGRAVESYICFAERAPAMAMLALNRLGLMSVLPRFAFVVGRGKVPEEASRERVAEWVAVRAGDQRLAARTVECRGDYASTAAVGVGFAAALLGERGAEVPSTGCFYPDELFTLAEFEPALREAGIEVVDRTPGAASADTAAAA